MSPIYNYYDDDTDNTSRLGGLLKLIKSKGLLHLIKKAAYQFIFPIIRPLIKSESFLTPEAALKYCNDWFNISFANERTIEIPLVRNELVKYNDVTVLEIGNVLSHYKGQYPRTILDKYESHDDVLNVDIVDYFPETKFDCVVSISTIEHIGFNEKPYDPGKLLRALNHIIDNVLSEDGILLVTFPLGWNPNLDNSFVEGTLPFQKYKYFQRLNWKNEWECKTDKPICSEFPYGTYLGAVYLVVGEYRKSNSNKAEYP